MNLRKLIRFGSLLLFLSVMVSCTLEEEYTEFSYKLVPVTEILIPDTITFNQSYTFKITYTAPTSCYRFSGFDYQQQGHQRIVGVVTALRADCSSPATPVTKTQDMQFIAHRQDYYLFKFWQGTDSLGQALYLTKKVIVTDKEL